MIQSTPRNRFLEASAQFAFALLITVACCCGSRGQDVSTAFSADAQPAGLSPEVFRTEVKPINGGAEIITIFARRGGGDLPLLSVMRDTLGDGKPENDRLRYVWLHTYTRPSLAQKLSAIVPFLYARTTNNDDIGKQPPPALVDLNRPAGSGGWDTLFWQVFKRVVLADAGHVIKASALQYRENKEDYRRTAIATTLAVLSIYQQTSGDTALSEQELQDIQARLQLKGKLFGAHMQPENLGRVYDKELGKARDERSQNWELLRQMCERQGLVFEPLKMPDGTARHAIVWVAQEDVAASRTHKWDGRFLNIKDPWSDKRIASWTGYKETRWYDAEDREVSAGTEGATSRTLIPLAVYGLENPRIPAILVDFRSNANPKMREMSRRVLNDVLNNVLSVSRFSSLPLFLGKFTYDFVTRRRGVDIDQQSRMRSYAQLKLLIQLTDSLEPRMENEVADRVEAATLNPLQNDAEVEEKLARAQYANLIAWADRDDGLPKKLSDDRREELVRVTHPGLPVRIGFSLAHFVTFGAYTHRETATPDLFAKMDLKRQLDYHERYVREVANRTNDPEIDSNLERLKLSLAFLSTGGKEAGGKTARSVARIFSLSKDEDTRSLCLAGLYKINSEGAKREMLAIYKNQTVPPHWRETSARYLKAAVEEGQRVSKADAKAIAGISIFEGN